MDAIKEDFGIINVSDTVIAEIVGIACKNTAGIVGMVSQNLKDGFYELLKKDVESKGVKISFVDGVLNLEVFIKVMYGINIPQIGKELASIINHDIRAMVGDITTNITINVQAIQIDEMDKNQQTEVLGL